MTPQRRRGTTDSLNPVKEPRWLVVRDACSRATEFEALAPRTDLRAALQRRTAALAADGWQARRYPQELQLLLLSARKCARVRRDRVLRTRDGRAAARVT